MQRLEVSGAVRPIYVSLGVKRLYKDARSTKHKKHKILSIILRCRNLADEPSDTAGFNPSAHFNITLLCCFPWGSGRRNTL